MYNPQLKTFITVADSGSFNKAAELLFVSSTAVIKQMNLLEERMNVRLFHRSHKGLSLTDAGKVLYKDAKHIIKYSDNTLRRMKDAERGSSDIVRIGTSPLTPIDYLTNLVSELQKNNIQFKMVPFENNPENARQILDNLGKDIDVVMGIYDKLTDQYYQKTQRLTVETLPFMIMMGSTDSLAVKDQIDWSDLDGRRVYVLESSWSKTFTHLREDIRNNHPNIEVVGYPFLDTEAFNRCLNDGDLFVGVPTWVNVHPFLIMKPMCWDYAIDYGIVYGQEPSDAVMRFIEIVKEHL